MEVEECNTSLSLSIGGDGDFSGQSHGDAQKSLALLDINLFQPRATEEEEEPRRLSWSRSKSSNEEEGADARDSREGSSSKAGAKRKLRLTRDQLTLLEYNFEFRKHSILNQTQKQELANQLNLQPRQVEVWFQNRRARDKLKKTEVDCGLLKKWCESLCVENRRLKRELEELRAVKPTLPLCRESLKVTPMTMCPSCKRITTALGGDEQQWIGYHEGPADLSNL